jgi:glycosyltransferase involved in cell wall biosynthesis
VNRHAPGRIPVLIVGQTPPPYGGQAIMIEALVHGDYERIEVFHVRMSFSDQLADAGRFGLAKLVHLPVLVARVLWMRLRTGARVLYYPPTGPTRMPLYRDLLVLPMIRWAFRHTVFLLHAGGVSELYDELPRPLRFLFRRAYGRPDLVISSSDLNPPDGEAFGALRSVTFPLGIPDHAASHPASTKRGTGTPRILYVGFISESKGALVLLQTAGELRRRGVDFEMELMGEFESPAFRSAFEELAREEGVTDRVRHLGVRTGAQKFDAFRDADIFFFPSHFYAETFGVVLLEAMQFELPVVSTRWRGIPSVVEEGTTALLAPIKDPVALADALERLIGDPELRRKLGEAGRSRFLDLYEEHRYTGALEACIVALDGSAPG